MIPKFTAVHNKFKLNGRHYTFERLKDVAYSFIKEGEPHEIEIGEFLLQWTDSSKTVTVKTSGSTGKPKSINLSKQAMVHSAIATGDYFKLKPGNSALMCLPATFIAGKMMIVRAIILGLRLDLVVPNSNPLAFLRKKYLFAAMVPMQLNNSLEKLYKIRTLIVGGTKVSDDLVEKIQESSSTVYATYGMTETITHIAVKKLNKFKAHTTKAYFEVLPNVEISQDDRGCLVINAPYLGKLPIVTNDVVMLHSNTTFELLGRLDNVINSGGIKIQPEQLEAKLAPYINADFFIASQENDMLGEEIVLVIEGKERELYKDIFSNLKKYEIPKEVIFLESFARTSSGKINRHKTLEFSKKVT
ncbi:MAG: AMP-binding protein [Flavobacteriaceae bacterium]|nr:AMP-binding protein [Flavobacteriaceae bacterium]